MQCHVHTYSPTASHTLRRFLPPPIAESKYLFARFLGKGWVDGGYILLPGKQGVPSPSLRSRVFCYLDLALSCAGSDHCTEPDSSQMTSSHCRVDEPPNKRVPFPQLARSLRLLHIACLPRDDLRESAFPYQLFPANGYSLMDFSLKVLGPAADGSRWSYLVDPVRSLADFREPC